MSKDKLNHRNKSKKVKEHKELNINDFNDMLKHKPRRVKENRTLFDKEREERGGYRDHKKKDYKHKGKYKSNKPNHS